MKPKRQSVIPLILVLLVALTSYTTSSRSESSPVTLVSPIHTLKATGGGYSVAFSPDGEMLAAGNFDGTIQLFSVSDGSLLRTMRAPLPNDPYKKNANTISFRADGRVLASGHDDGNVRLWQVSTGTLLRTLKGSSGRVLSVSFSPNGQMLAMGSDALPAGSHGITLWLVSDDSILRTFDDGDRIVAFSPDGQTLAVDDGFSIKLLKVSDGSLLRTLTWGSHFIGANSLAFSPDGETLAVACSGDCVLMFRVSDGRLLYVRETLIRNLYHALGTNAVVFSPDGKALLTAGGGGLEKTLDILSTIRIWQASNGRLLHTYKLSGYSLASFSISPDGQTLAAGFVNKDPILWRRSDKQTEILASQCTAPNANTSKHLYVLGLNCRQLWEYYLYYRFSIPTFQAAGDLISLAEKRALQVYEFVDKINLILGPLPNIATSRGVEMKIATAVWESSGLLLNLTPLGNADSVKFAQDLFNWMRDSLAASFTETASPPYVAMVELANRFGTLWNIQFKVLDERNAIRLADEYLTLYYRNGGDAAKVAAVYGLLSSATTEDVMKMIAKQWGMGRLDYDLEKASQWVSSFKVAISNAANVCLQGSTCTGSQVSPTSTISEQKQIRETLNKQSNKLKTNKTIPAVKPKAKADSRASCNKSSNVLSPSTGSAQGALKKYGTDSNGCAQ
jgi:WD40 repeat protein